MSEHAPWMADRAVTLWACANGVFWPVFTLDADAYLAKGYDGRFMLTYFGQRSQLIVTPAGLETSTPQDDCPEQPAASMTGGKPPADRLSTVDQITVFFATGQSYDSSSIASSPSVAELSGDGESGPEVDSGPEGRAPILYPDVAAGDAFAWFHAAMDVVDAVGRLEATLLSLQHDPDLLLDTTRGELEPGGAALAYDLRLEPKAPEAAAQLTAAARAVERELVRLDRAVLALVHDSSPAVRKPSGMSESGPEVDSGPEGRAP